MRVIINYVKMDVVPVEMRASKNWVNFRIEEKAGRKAKIPYTPLGKKAKCNDLNTWSSLEEVNKARGFQGIGFELGNSKLIGIDIDHCVANGNLSSLAKELVEKFKSYTEYSPSREGVHILIKSDEDLSSFFNSDYINKNTQLGLEIYNKDRYFTFTGNIINNGYTQVEDRTEELKQVKDKYLKKKSKNIPEACKTSNIPVFNILGDQDIINRMKEEPVYNDLFLGNWEGHYSSQSEADLALCAKLAFYTNKNSEQIDKIFRGSGLYRDKWERTDYGENTIKTAINTVSSTYDRGYYNKEQSEKREGGFPDVKGKEGRPDKRSINNLRFLYEQLGIKLKFNLLTKEIEFEGNTEIVKNTRTLASNLNYILTMCSRNNFEISERNLEGFTVTLARENEYNPITNNLEIFYREYGNSSDAFYKLLDCFKLNTGVLEEREEQEKEEFIELSRKLITKWFVSAVVMAFNDEGKEAAQGTLVLQGKQGLGKTQFMTHLIPDEKWLSTGLSWNTDRDSLLNCTRAWLNELGELGSSLKESRLNELKAFITQPADTIRIPWGRSSERFPRRSVYYGTTNNIEFLKDATGERRFWVIPVLSIDTDNFPSPAEFWGSVMYLWKDEKTKHYLDMEEIKLLNKFNNNYKKKNSIEILLEELIDLQANDEEKEWISSSEITTLLGLNKEKVASVGKILTNWERRGLIEKKRNNRGYIYLVSTSQYSEPEVDFKSSFFEKHIN